MTDIKSFIGSLKEALNNPIPGAVEPVETTRARVLNFVRQALKTKRKIDITKEMIDCGLESEIKVMIMQHEQKHYLMTQLDRAEEEADLEESFIGF